MLSALRLFLLSGILLAAVLARGDDQLPTLGSINVSPNPDRATTVTCYLGNPSDQQTLGSITANSPGEAGPACNSLYYVCRGRCFGCYSDFDLSEDVCVDGSGRKYLR